MSHQTLSLEKYWKLFSATLTTDCIEQNKYLNKLAISVIITEGGENNFALQPLNTDFLRNEAL